MIVFDAEFRQALRSGAVAAAAAIVAALAVAALALALPVSFATYFLILLALAALGFAAWSIYYTYALRHTSYAVDRNAFVIRWGAVREIVPMGEVQRVLPATEIASALRFRRVPLPGWWSGMASHPELGRIRLYATAPPDRQVVIVTPEMSYAVSPPDVAEFVQAFDVRFRMGPTQAVRHARLAPAAFNLALWREPVALLLLLLPVLLNLVMFGLAFARYPALTDPIVLHFNTAGLPDRFGQPALAFSPAVIALGLLALDMFLGALVYRLDKLAAYLLWGGGAGVQLLFLVATITISFNA